MNQLNLDLNDKSLWMDINRSLKINHKEIFYFLIRSSLPFLKKYHSIKFKKDIKFLNLSQMISY